MDLIAVGAVGNLSFIEDNSLLLASPAKYRLEGHPTVQDPLMIAEAANLSSVVFGRELRSRRLDRARKDQAIPPGEGV